MINTTVTVHFMLFLTTCMHSKIRPVSTFRPVFTLFSFPPVSLHPTTPIQTRHYRFTCSCAPLRLICKNMMSGEISPAMGPKSGPVRPPIPPACLVCVFPVPPTPQHTHPHPLTPIHTYFFPCEPYFSCIYV